VNKGSSERLLEEKLDSFSDSGSNTSVEHGSLGQRIHKLLDLRLLKPASILKGLVIGILSYPKSDLSKVCGPHMPSKLINSLGQSRGKIRAWVPRRHGKHVVNDLTGQRLHLLLELISCEIVRSMHPLTLC
jgi:hypothetical protein